MLTHPSACLFSSQGSSAASLTSSMGTHCSAVTLMEAKAGSLGMRRSGTTRAAARKICAGEGQVVDGMTWQQPKLRGKDDAVALSR